MNTEIIFLTKALYLGSADVGDRELEQFYLRNMDRIASFVNDEESLIISAVRAARRISADDVKAMFPHLRDEMLDNMILRGLLKMDDEGFCTTSCVQASALHPLFGTNSFGTGRKRRADEMAKAILSVIGSESIGIRELRSIFSAKGGRLGTLFPYLVPYEAEKAFHATLSSLLELGVVVEGERRLRIDFRILRPFLELEGPNLYSYLLWPRLDEEERKNSIRFLNLLFISGCVDGECFDTFIGRLRILSSFNLPDTAALFSFLLLAHDGEGRVYVRASDDCGDGGVSISSDYSISVTGRTPPIIYMTSTAVQIDRIRIYRMDRMSIRTAFNLGLDAEDVVGELRRCAGLASSNTLFERIRSWYREFSRIRIKRGMVLMTDARSANILSSIPSFMEYVIKDSGNGFFLMDEAGEENWRRILEKGGFDLLAEPEGPEFAEPEAVRTPFVSHHVSPVFTQKERGIPYDAASRESYSANGGDRSLDALKTILVRTGIVFDVRMFDRPLPFAERDAFDYQEKLRLIQYAYRNRDFCLQVENHRGQSAVGRVGMVEDYQDGDHMVLGRKVLNISRLYKVRLIPAAYLTSPNRPSTDNDSRRTPRTGACPAQEASRSRNEDGNRPCGPL